MSLPRNYSSWAFANIENKLIASNKQNTIALKCILPYDSHVSTKDMCWLTKTHASQKRSSRFVNDILGQISLCY